MSQPNVFQKIAINHFGKPKNKKSRDALNKIKEAPMWKVFNNQQEYKTAQT